MSPMWRSARNSRCTRPDASLCACVIPKEAKNLTRTFSLEPTGAPVSLSRWCSITCLALSGFAAMTNSSKGSSPIMCGRSHIVGSYSRHKSMSAGALKPARWAHVPKGGP
eukprot:scaffold3458_cov66-Phaeocystis_antarctica.AAC.3